MSRHTPYPKRQTPERWRDAAETCARHYGYTFDQLIAPCGGMAIIKVRHQVYSDLAQMGANPNAIARLMKRHCNGVVYGIRHARKPYNPIADAQAGYALWVSEMRRQHLARAVMRDTEEGREDVGCLRQASRVGD